MYIGTVILRRSEKEFWKMTMRKLIALYDEHKLINGWSSEDKESTAYIDQVL